MTDQTKPETIHDDDLDQAAGGLGNFEIQDLMVDLPNAAATGLPTGKRMHKPLTALKEVDKASPLLAQ